MSNPSGLGLRVTPSQMFLLRLLLFVECRQCAGQVEHVGNSEIEPFGSCCWHEARDPVLMKTEMWNNLITSSNCPGCNLNGGILCK